MHNNANQALAGITKICAALRLAKVGTTIGAIDTSSAAWYSVRIYGADAAEIDAEIDADALVVSLAHDRQYGRQFILVRVWKWKA